MEEVIMYGNSVKLVFDLDELRYYFDAEQRDSIDRGGISRKSGEVLALREKMVLLPDQKFDLAMKTMKKMVDESMPAGESETKEERSETAHELYSKTEKVNAIDPSSTSIVSPI